MRAIVLSTSSRVAISRWSVLGRDTDRRLIWAKLRLHSYLACLLYASPTPPQMYNSDEIQCRLRFPFEMTDNNAIRKSQRQPLACRHCTRAKLRCSKDIPCTRCRTKGLACSREAVIVAARNINTTHNQALQGKYSESSSQSFPQAANTVQKEETEAQPSGVNDRQPSSNNNSPTSRSSPATTSTSPQFEDLPTAIEGLAWDRHQCHRYPHTECLRPPHSTLKSKKHFISNSLLSKLPDLVTSRMLVKFHLEQLAWYHNTIHVPTFMACCEAFWHFGAMPDPQWLPLYLAVLSASMWTLTNSPLYGSNGTMSSTSCQAMFELATTQIFQSKSLARHTIYSVQAICICAMVANVLDSSDQMTVLVNAAVRIAQCLGLHRIPDEESIDMDWLTRIQREVGRRIWWKLVELDYHSMPYTGTLSMCATQSTSSTRLTASRYPSSELHHNTPSELPRRRSCRAACIRAHTR